MHFIYKVSEPLMEKSREQSALCNQISSTLVILRAVGYDCVEYN